MSKNAAPIKGFQEFKRFVVARLNDREITPEQVRANRLLSKQYRESQRAPSPREKLAEWCGRNLK